MINIKFNVLFNYLYYWIVNIYTEYSDIIYFNLISSLILINIYLSI